MLLSYKSGWKLSIASDYSAFTGILTTNCSVYSIVNYAGQTELDVTVMTPVKLHTVR